MMAAAKKACQGDGRAHVVQASAERLPFTDEQFELVTSTLSFHHWSDQRAGLREM